MKLHDIKPPLGSKHHRKRVGRGNASGHGGQSTRGHKGHKSRSGFSHSYNFEGGQMPLARRLPKRGFTHIKKSPHEIVNLSDIERKFNDGDKIFPESLLKAGLVKKGIKVKILGDGELKKKVEISAHSFSLKAKTLIEKAGGKALIIKTETDKDTRKKSKSEKS
ncbi:MAG TPA: 50S ribosomal protein L15 [bacterium]|nr:50S ribosomal protein L15 [bacterium]